jgi:hypothetical protein
VYLLTFLFRPLGKGQRATVLIMQRELELFYAKLLTRVIRHPKREANQGRLPILIAVPDSPVAKHHPTGTLADVLQNNGIHFHGVMFVPKRSRIKGKLKRHVKENRRIYAPPDGPFTTIDVRRVREPEGRLMDYLLKHIKRRTFSLDDILILPRSTTEASTNPRQ